MRKLLLTLLISNGAFAATTFTTYYDLSKPSDGDTNWGVGYRSNLDEIDEQMHINATDISDHITSVTAHTAAHISSTAGVVCTSATDVQAFLTCLDANVAGYVTTSGTQTISGAKTFTNTLTLTGAVTLSSLTANRALYLDSSKNIQSSDVSDTELGYLDGVTSSIQTQINDINTTGGDYVLKAGSTMTGQLVVSGANIGAGTTSPSRRLHARNDSDAATGVLVENQSTGTAAAAEVGFTNAVGSNIGTIGLKSALFSTALQANRFVIGASSLTDGLHFSAGTGNDHVWSSLASTELMRLSSAGLLSLENLTADRAVYGNGSKQLVSSSGVTSAELEFLDGVTSNIGAKLNQVTVTEVGYLSGVTQAVQTQLNNKLETSTAATTYVAKAGDTMTGQLRIDDISGGDFFVLNGVTPMTRAVSWKTNNVLRWLWSVDQTAESGSDAGSNINLRARTDAGAAIDNPISVVRAAGGAITLNRPVTANGVITGSLTGTASNNVLRAGDTMTGSLGLNYTNATPDRAAYVDAARILRTSANVTSAELEFLDGVTGAIQTQINNIVTGGSFVAKSGDTMTGALMGVTGTVSAVAFGVGAANTGLYSPAAGSLNISLGGALRTRFNGSTQLFTPASSNSFVGMDTSDGSDNKYLFVGGGGSDSPSRGAIVAAFGNEVSSSQGGNVEVIIGTPGTNALPFFGVKDNVSDYIMQLDNNGQMQMEGGTVALPNYTFEGDKNTGFSSTVADQVTTSVGGVAALTVSTATVGTSVRIHPGTGTALTPYVGLKTAGGTTSYDMTLPTALPSAAGSYSLTSTTAGVLSFTDTTEYVESKSATLTAWSTNAAWGDVTSISIPAGTWDITGVVNMERNGSTITVASVGISTTSGNDGTGLNLGENNIGFMPPTSASNTFAVGIVANYRVTIGSTTTHYLKLNASFAVADPRIVYRIYAKRVSN